MKITHRSPQRTQIFSSYPLPATGSRRYMPPPPSPRASAAYLACESIRPGAACMPKNRASMSSWVVVVVVFVAEDEGGVKGRFGQPMTPSSTRASTSSARKTAYCPPRKNPFVPFSRIERPHAYKKNGGLENKKFVPEVRTYVPNAHRHICPNR